MSDERWTPIVSAADVTEEILTMAEDAAEGYALDDSGRIDWECAIDRLDGLELRDGSRIDLGSSIDSPAIRKIKREVRKRLADN